MQLRNAWTDQVRTVNDVDLIVFSGYRLAEDRLLAPFAERTGLEVHPVGDCRAPRMLRNAVSEGVRVGALL